MIKKLLTRKRAMDLFLEFERTDILSKASRKINTTQGHAAKLLSEFIELELIRKEKHGRINLLTYTEKGIKLREILKELSEC